MIRGMIGIREAVLTDSEALHALGRDVSEFSVNEATVSFWPKAILERAIGSNDVLVFVAEAEGGELVGFIIATYVEGLSKATIENIYVAPSQRSQGIGDILLGQLLAALQERSCQYVATLVPPNASSAVELYTKTGFSRGETFLWLDAPLSQAFSRETGELYGG
jgi:ribosomal protein S18 acetylase RimI-like enzyme